MKKLIFLCGIVCTAVYVQGMEHRLTKDGTRGVSGQSRGQYTAPPATGRIGRTAAPRAACPAMAVSVRTTDRQNVLGNIYRLTAKSCRGMKKYTLLEWGKILADEQGITRPGRDEYARREAMVCWIAEHGFEELQRMITWAQDQLT